MELREIGTEFWYQWPMGDPFDTERIGKQGRSLFRVVGHCEGREVVETIDYQTRTAIKWEHQELGKTGYIQYFPVKFTEWERK